MESEPATALTSSARQLWEHPADFHPAPSDATITRPGPQDPDLGQFLLAADAGELEESGIAGMALRYEDEPLGAERVLAVERTATTPGILLRPWAEQDIPAMVAAHRDPVMRTWLRHPVASADEARRIIQARHDDARAGTCFSFAVLLAEPGIPGDLAGSVSIRGLGDAAVSGEVGYWVTAPARGRGIAARAVEAVCEWAFSLPRRRPLERVELLHSVGNHASCRVAEKAGFAFSAVLPPLLPEFPDDGHLHIRLAGQQAAVLPGDP